MPSYIIYLCPGRGRQQREYESMAPGFGICWGRGTEKILKVTPEELSLEL